jgi:cellulose synthase/poly-beta-1,6-N-acetylglucosamine synthase-like glycosyltransferase
MDRGVSIVIPMYNAEKYIKKVLEAIFDQDYPAPVEVIVVNDGSTDASLKIVESFKDRHELKIHELNIINQPNSGAVSATNNGIKAATHDFICSIDSDVVICADWLSRIMTEFESKSVGAVQGYYKTPKEVSLLARLMGYDVEARYDAIPSKEVTQVCTGDTAYRKSALDKVGLFDGAFKYGYDNDMSYRLQAGGYRLIFRKDAVCDHYWKADLPSYIRQQYHSAYGRMQLLQKHTDRLTGDSVSGIRMIAQVPLTLFFIFTFVAWLLLSAVLVPAVPQSATSLTMVALSLEWFASLSLGLILFDRVFFAASVYAKQRDVAVILLPVVHLLRNFVWCAALVVWCVKRDKIK